MQINQTNRPIRRIRSFVRREGRMTQTQTKAWERYWSLYGLDIKAGVEGDTSEPPKPFDLNQIFGRPSDKIIEIGFGDGKSLVEMAKNAPDKDFIGIEVYRTGVGSLLGLIAKEGISNLKVICSDAKEVLEHRILDNSLAGVQIFFADPWPKTRHHKRRLIQDEFVSLIAQKLKPGGILHLATDWQHYADHMLQVLSEHRQFHNMAADNQFMPRPDFRPFTKYEQRGLKLGHKTWDLIFSRLEL